MDVIEKEMNPSHTRIKYPIYHITDEKLLKLKFSIFSESTIFQKAPPHDINNDIRQSNTQKSVSFHHDEIWDVLNTIFLWICSIFFCRKRNVLVCMVLYNI